MGAHSTFEQALAGVTAFATAVASDSEPEEHRPKKSKKSKSKKDKKEKKSSKHRSNDKKKHKKRKKSDSSSEDGDSDSDKEAVEVQLERGRSAARNTRQIMSYFPSAKTSLRQMFWRLDNQEAVSIANIPVPSLRELLEVLFDNLRLVKVSQGVFAKRKDMEPILRQLGPILDEEPAHPSTFEAKPAAQADEELLDNPGIASPITSPDQDAEDQAAEANGNGIGPQMPADFQPEPAAEPQPPAPVKRVIGPAVPPAALLDQAAEVAAAMAAEEAAQANEIMIGPPPPDLVEEMEAASGDARVAEVIRITKLLDSAKDDKPADPYAIVGVEADAEAGAIKKRYWRLSLLIHPDKCSHPQAQRVFNAVSQAAKALQDAGSRSEIDKRREDAEFEAFAAAELAKQEKARQWRVARGEATAEDLQGPLKSGPAEREEWLTVLPASRRPSAPSQKSKTSFSQQGVAAINQDASTWTDTPAAKLLRLQQASAAMLPSTAEAVQKEKAVATASAVDEYNQTHRAKTLVEQHQERQKKEKRAKKKAKQEGTQQQPQQQAEAQHPWRPFDRERDLKMPSAGGNPLDKLGDLSTRFGGGKTSRGFL